MSIVTPGSGSGPVNIEDYVKTPFVVDSVKIEQGHKFKPDSKPAAHVTAVFAVEGDEDTKVSVFFNVALGESKASGVAKCRAIVNAIAGREKESPVAAIDNATLEFWLDALPQTRVDADGTVHALTPPDGRIAPGARLVGLGEKKASRKGEKNDDGTIKKYFELTTFFPAKKQTAAAAKTAASATKNDPTDF